MKKCLILPLVLLLSTVAFSQDNAIKANLLSPLFNTGNFQYERVVGEKSTAQLGFFFSSVNFDETKFRGFGITPEYRFYPGGTTIDGFFVAPYFRYQSFNLSDDADNEGTATFIGGGLIVGRQWIFGDVVTFEVFIGPNYSSGDVEVTSGQDSFDVGFFDGFGARFGLSLGFAF